MSTRMGDRNSKEEILKIFNLFDLDNNNGVTFDNLKQIASEIGKPLIFYESKSHHLNA